MLSATPPEIAEKPCKGSNHPDIGNDADDDRGCSLEYDDAEPHDIGDLPLAPLRKIDACCNSERNGQDAGENDEHASPDNSVKNTAPCLTNGSGKLGQELPVNDCNTISCDVIENKKQGKHCEAREEHDDNAKGLVFYHSCGCVVFHHVTSFDASRATFLMT